MTLSFDTDSAEDLIKKSISNEQIRQNDKKTYDKKKQQQILASRGDLDRTI